MTKHIESELYYVLVNDEVYAKELSWDQAYVAYENALEDYPHSEVVIVKVLKANAPIYLRKMDGSYNVSIKE